MGAEQTKPGAKLEEIDREVNLIRSNLRVSTRSLSNDNKNRIQENLIKYSNEASDLKGKVKTKRLDSTQKNISQTMTEVLTMDTNLDSAAVETDSIVRVQQNRSSLSLERPKLGLKSKNQTQSKSMPSLTNSPTLQDIDNKLKTLRSQIKVALQSEDSTQLRVHQETLKVLATSLELIDVPEFTPLDDKKKKIEGGVAVLYQKISKALREIRRNRDIKYLSQQKQKDEIMKELEIIRREIEKYDVLAREASKVGDASTIRDVNENLKKLRKQISLIENVDENTKTLKLQMKDKISWLGKYITDSSQKGSQPDLTKAQAEYEDIIKNIARGKNKNGIDLKEQLESLQNFAVAITSQDEDDIKKKKHLLNNINESLFTLNEKAVGKKNHTVDIGVLDRNTPFENKMLDNCIGTWQILESALQKTKLSQENFHRVDNALSDLQKSVIEIRKLLVHRHNQLGLSASVPNLAADNAIDSHFVHRWSEKAETDSMKKKKSNVENVESNHVEESINIRNKDKTRQEEIRFSKINDIKTQVYYIKEKFESSIQKPNLKTRLESYTKTLEEYINSDNKVIANNAEILLTDIKDVIKKIDRCMTSNNEQLPSEYYSDTILHIEDNVIKLEKTAKSFQADRNLIGYQNVKKMLNENKEYLETIDVPIQYEIPNKHRLKLLEKIEQIIEECERESSARENAYVKEVKTVLDNLKDRTNRFSGPYKGVLYNAIEKDLNKILIDADANIANKVICDQILKETEKFLQILEQRATKDQSLEPEKKDDAEKMSALKEELQAVKDNIDATPLNAIDLFIGLNSRLDLIKLSLDQLKQLSEHIEHQKEIIYTEIESLKNVVGAKIALGQQDINPTSLEEFKTKTTEENNRRVTDELDKVDLTLEKLKHDITTFIGTKSDKKYYELDESTMRLILKMDDLKLPKDSPLFDRKVNLLKVVHQYEDLLDKRAKETEYLAQFERDITDIENNFSRYTKSIKDLDNLAERVNTLKTNLETGKCNTPLYERKKSCLKRMSEMSAQIQTTINESILNEENLLQIKYNLEVIKKSVQQGNISTAEISKKLSSIRDNLLGMENLNAGNVQQREDLLKELETLENNFRSKPAKIQTPTNKQVNVHKVTQNKIDKDFLEIEQELSKVNNEIKLFVGTTNTVQFCELDEAINKLVMKLDEMTFSKDNSYYLKKIQLLKDLHYSSELLDKRAEDTEILLEFEAEIAAINHGSSKFNQEYISSEIGKLERWQVVEDLSERKNRCLEDLKKLLNNQNVDQNTSSLTLFENQFMNIQNRFDKLDELSPESSYLDIDNSLQKLSSDIQQVRTDSTYDQKKNELLQQIESFRHSLEKQSKETKIYGVFIKELDIIKNQINIINVRAPMIKMHNKLKFIQADVEKAPLKEALKNDIHRKCTLLLQSYSEKVNSLPKINYIGSVDFLKDLEVNSGVATKPPRNSFEQQFEMLSNEVSEMESKVAQFVGHENSETYRKLEEELLKVNVKVKKLNDLKKSEYSKKKHNLKERTVNCLTMLDANMQEFENLLDMENELRHLDMRLKDSLTEKERDTVDEQLISLQVKIGKLNHTNKSLFERKNEMIQKIAALMRIIKQKASNSNSEDSGTSI